MIRDLFAALGPEYARPLRRLLVLMCAAAVLQGVAFAFLVPILEAVLGGRTSDAWWWLAALGAVWLAYAVTHFSAALAGFHTGARVCQSLHHRIGDKVSQLPLAWFTADRVGQLGRLTSQRVIDVMAVPAHLLRELVDAFLTPAVVVLVVFVFDWRLATALAASGATLAVVYRLTGNWVQAADRGADAIHAEACGRIVEFARAQPVLRAFGRTVDGNRLLTAALTAQRAASWRLITAALPGVIALGVVAQASFTLVLLLGTSFALGGTIAAAQMIALLALAARFVEPIVLAGDLGAALRVARNALTDMNRLLATDILPEPALPKQPRGGGIELDAVAFSYGDGEVLRGISMQVPDKSLTALVGASGSGKTTITRLIARLFDVDSGSVRVGGIDVREMRTEDLMASIALVFQDVYLFEGSILDNIRIGRPDASDAEVLAAAHAAALDEIVERLPAGWDTPVGEGGTRLSGGERQRVSIARAILKDAAIVLFDEATAALDPENERALQRAMSALAADRTVLVIAHRLQTIMNADRIVVLADGVVAEEGRHEQLMALDGRYAEFWRERKRALGWRLSNRGPGASERVAGSAFSSAETV